MYLCISCHICVYKTYYLFLYQRVIKVNSRLINYVKNTLFWYNIELISCLFMKYCTNSNTVKTILKYVSPWQYSCQGKLNKVHILYSTSAKSPNYESDIKPKDQYHNLFTKPPINLILLQYQKKSQQLITTKVKVKSL